MPGRAPRPVLLGEVVFDCFPDGERVLGGAAFNLAWHLHALELDPLLVSRVGPDALGQEVRDAMLRWGLDDAGLQVDESRPTGQVTVTVESGEPSFDILPDQAYDYIDADLVAESTRLSDSSLIYHGTLAVRSEKSRHALRHLRAHAPGVPVFLDVNLRNPWWDRERVRADIRRATWVKMNEAELDLLSARRLQGSVIAERASDLLHRGGPRVVWVTRGGAGAVLAADEGVASLPAPEVGGDELVDTVGAGDAFSAVSVFGILEGWPRETTLRRALAFAADICRIRGATPQGRELYDRHLARWQEGAW